MCLASAFHADSNTWQTVHGLLDTFSFFLSQRGESVIEAYLGSKIGEEDQDLVGKNVGREGVPVSKCRHKRKEP